MIMKNKKISMSFQECTITITITITKIIKYLCIPEKAKIRDSNISSNTMMYLMILNVHYHSKTIVIL